MTLHQLTRAVPFRRLVLMLLALFMGGVASVACAQTFDGVPVLRVGAPLDGRLVVAVTQVLEDPDGTLELADVPQARGWRAGPPDAYAFGFSDAVFWARLGLHNGSDVPRRLVFDLGHSRQDHATWYELRAEDLGISHTGDRQPFAEREVVATNIAHLLEMAPGERLDLYIRLEAQGMFEAMPMRVYDEQTFYEAQSWRKVVLSLFHGGLLALGLYNLLLFISTRTLAFGLYTFYIGCFLAWSFTFHGHAFQHLWPNAPSFNHHFLTVSTSWAFGSFMLFAIAYLRLRENIDRWLLRLVQCLALANFLVLVPAFTTGYATGAAIGHVVGMVSALTVMGIGIYLLWQGNRQARFFVAAFTLLIIGVAAYILQIIALVPTNWFTTWGLQIGSGIEVLLLALGLADSLNVMKADKLKAEREARAMEQALNATLEQQIAERTNALEMATLRLSEMAIIDDMTGAYNRRHFNAFCSDSLAAHRRKDNVAFCIFDIDRFKAFNDLYGHQAGDGALRDIAHAVQEALQRHGDALFRLGGEEFGVLFSAKSEEQAFQFIDEMRETIELLGIVHEDSPEGVVTASFGVVWWHSVAVAELTPELMYAAADEVLYRAKREGRNRVVVEARPLAAQIAAGGS